MVRVGVAARTEMVGNTIVFFELGHYRIIYIEQRLFDLDSGFG
jgi:hypothetical protein